MATVADVGLRFLIDEYGEAEAARLLMISNQTLRRWLKRGVPKKEADRIRLIYRSNHARDQVEALLRDAQSCTADHLGHMPFVRVSLNSDGTVDGQMTVYDIPWGKTIHDLILDVQECASALRNLDNAFIQAGIRWSEKEGEIPRGSGDRRYRGLNEAVTYWYHSDRWVDMWLYLMGFRKGKKMHGIAVRVAAKRYNKKVETIFLRVHWNEHNRTPRR